MALPQIDRRAFLEQLTGSIETSKGANRHTALLLLDLTNLPEINLQESLATGDRLIALAYRTLLRIARHERLLHRTSGHTFGLVIENLSSPALLVVAVSRIRQQLLEALEVDPSRIPARLCVGVSATYSKPLTAAELLASAEGNLIQSRAGAPFEPEKLLTPVNPEATDEALKAALAIALQQNQFELHFQPQMHLSTGKISGVEGLLRWRHPTLGFISPEQVVSMAANLGNSFELTRAVVQMGVRALGEWQKKYPDLALSLNISADLVGRADVVDLLNSAVKIWGVEPRLVMVEMTEQAVVQDMEVGSHSLAALRKRGFGVSIDDFGTGYSSLSYFRDIPATELKIDRSFVSRLLDSKQDFQLVRIICDIAQLFDMTVIAEGVENVQTLSALQRLGCDYAQGFFIARPMPLDQLMAWLGARPGLHAFPEDPAAKQWSSERDVPMWR